jgi:hypothetical protein
MKAAVFLEFFLQRELLTVPQGHGTQSARFGGSRPDLFEAII